MQAFHHRAVEADRAARDVFRKLERGDDFSRARDFLLGRGEDRVAGLDLRGMDQRLAVEAEVANVSLRTVFREFAESGRGSPGQFARRVRLHRAAELLRRPDAQTSVLAVAFKCEFRNLGRFASEYRQEIGELPSETLKNSRRRQ